MLDLGSGGGIDVLLSARRVGPTGKVYGLDMTDEMLALARANQAKSGLTNVEFLRGEIERIPLPNDSVDVIISNCVINLSADKDQDWNSGSAPSPVRSKSGNMPRSSKPPDSPRSDSSRLASIGSKTPASFW